MALTKPPGSPEIEDQSSGNTHPRMAAQPCDRIFTSLLNRDDASGAAAAVWRCVPSSDCKGEAGRKLDLDLELATGPEEASERARPRLLLPCQMCCQLSYNSELSFLSGADDLVRTVYTGAQNCRMSRVSEVLAMIGHSMGVIYLVLSYFAFV